MLAIRLQRTGRKGTPNYRMVVQDARRTPTSGKIVVSLGSYDPHQKALSIDKEKAAFYLSNGAQPSPRVAVLLKEDGVKLPKWVAIKTDKKGVTRNADKRRSTRPAEPAQEVEAPQETEVAEATPEAAVVEETTEAQPAEA